MTLVLAGLFVIVNGLFVAMEFALLSAVRSRVETEAEAGSFVGRLALRSMSRLGPLLAGCQLGVTAASLGLGSVGEPALGHVFERALHGLGVSSGPTRTLSFVLALTVVVFVHLVAGEMVPKNIALVRPEQTLMALAIPVSAFAALFKPLIWALNQLAALGARLVGVSPTAELRSVATSAQLALILEESRQEGILEESDHGLLSGALGLLQRQAGDVMVPRDGIVTVARSASVSDVEVAIHGSGHSRLLLTGSGLDDIVGFVHAKDLLRVPAFERHRPIPQSMVHSTIQVPPGRTLDTVLVAMQRTRRHLAVVVGERRRTLGMVTLEDVLESIVGGIAVSDTQRSN